VANVTRRAAKRMTRAATSKPNLRDLQKASTRQRILEAARDVFYREGYYGATIDQIVAAIGSSRQTFYLHFSDKEQVLAQLMADYTARGSAYMERLPGPRPTVDELRAWLLEVSVFFEEEKASFSVLGEVSAHPATHSRYGQVPSDVNGKMTVDAWMSTLARRSASFATALSRNEYQVDALARGRLLILQAIWASSLAWEQRGSKLADITLTVVAKAFHEFLNDPRLTKHQTAARTR
jgi:AcrR family transcriptional regulator